MYNAKGKPEFALVPIRPQPTYDITDKDIIKAVNEVREELSQKYAAKKASRTR